MGHHGCDQEGDEDNERRRREAQKLKKLPKKAVSLNDYQAACEETAVYTKNNNIGGQRIVYCSLALAGEAGEVANLVKKALRDEGPEDCFYLLHKDRPSSGNVSASLKLEIGDVLWYVAMLAHECGFTLEEIAMANLEKLARRHGVASKPT